jgi:hypothetical protein
MGGPLTSTKSSAAQEVEQVYARAYELCQQVGETPQFFPALRGLWNHYQDRGKLQRAHGLAKQLQHFDKIIEIVWAFRTIHQRRDMCHYLAQLNKGPREIMTTDYMIFQGTY